MDVALARPRPGRRGEQPPPGRARRPARARRGGDRGSRRAARARGRGRRRPLRGGRGRRAAAPALPAAYRAALALYGGELLPENRYDDFAEERRDELARLAGDARARARRLGRGLGRAAPPAGRRELVRRPRARARRARGAAPARRACSRSPAPGGAGKTRLALELARACEASFADGAALVELAPLTEPGLVAETPSPPRSTCRRSRGRSSSTRSSTSSRRATLLLVLDNCEHLLGGGAALAEALLRAAPDLTVLATSREPLRVPGRGRLPRPVARHPRPRASSRRTSSLALEAVAAVRRARGAAVAPASRSTRRTRRTSRGSASASTGCRWRSSSRRAGSARSARRRSPSGSTTASASSAREPSGADAAADARGDAALEPRPARARRARALPPAGRVRGRLRARGRRGASAPATGSAPPTSPTCSARLVEKSLVSGRGARRRSAATGCSRPCASTRGSSSRRPGRRGARRAPRHWALALAEASSATRRASTATPRTCARRSTRCSRPRR